MKAVMRIAICDDDPADLAGNVSMVQSALEEMIVPNEIVSFQNAGELLAAIEAGAEFQLLLLDVLLDEMDGIALARALRAKNVTAQIIFISSNREMALRGYEVAAARYLPKPVGRDALTEALEYCCCRWKEQARILLPTEEGVYRLSPEEILYVEAYDRGTRFVLTSRTVESKLKFAQAAELLSGASFVHAHRAYIVNLLHVMRIRPNEFELKNGEHIPISKYRYAEIYKRFVSFISD